MLVEVANANGPEVKAKTWAELKDDKMPLAVHRKKRKESAKKGKKTAQSFNFGSSMRAAKTASTQIQKLKNPAIEGTKPEECEELGAQLEALRDELAKRFETV